MRSPRNAKTRMVAVVMGVGAMTMVGASVAQAASYSLSGRVPATGSQTYDANDFYTTSQFNDINFDYSQNPYSSSVKAVRCSNFTDISGYRGFGANDHTEKVLASNVQDGTCYNINIGPDSAFGWNFSAVSRS